TTNDIIRFSQRATSRAGSEMPVDGWKTGNMTVEIPTGLTMAAETASGRIVVTRSGLPPMTVDGLDVQLVGSLATMSFNADNFSDFAITNAIPGFTGFLDGDELVLSLAIKSTANA